MERSNKTFVSIGVEGAILPPELLARVTAGDGGLGGLSPADYHLLPGEKLNEATNRSWNRLVGAWEAFRAAVGKLPDADPATSVTRERWLLPLFQELGYGRVGTSRAQEIDGRTYSISHRWNSVPIHLVGCRVDIDTKTEGVAGAARMSPHGMLQEYLNRSDNHLWGFVSNALRLRILRDNSSLTRQAFVEFDLEAMMDGEVYSDFVLLWLLCHQSRVEAERPEEFWLEKWSRAAQEQGTRALDQLRNGVEEAISALGRGFLSYPDNGGLRERLREGKLDAQDYYRQLLRLVYRLLFLFAAEDRELLLLPAVDKVVKDRYLKFYSTARLRRLAGRKRGTRHADLFHGLRLVMEKLRCDDGCPELGLPALGSFLFSAEAVSDIEKCEISNADLLDAVRALAFTVEKNVRRPVDYKNLGSEELGSVYESLLELHPELNLDAGTFELRTAGGNERKTTGSYYTPTSLIQCLLDSALNPVIDEAVKKPDPVNALLDLKVCDPACGSGHFLIAAAHRIAKRLAAVRTGDEEPSPDATRSALRDVISRCIYGVDINPMSVELCKVALWMEAIDPGKPLSFLDHHIQCGNSLIGVTPRLLKEGIPDAAFDAIEGDDKAVCSEYKRKNKKEREGQGTLFSHDLQPWERLGDLATAMMDLGVHDDGTIAGEHVKEQQYERLVRSSQYEFGRLLADTWCAAFMWKKTREFDYPITEEVFRRIERTPHATPDWMRTEVGRLSKQYQFFHWHIAFPDVFRVPGSDEEPENGQTGWSGGFDCVLGNPPWERVKLQEIEFFAPREPSIANAPNKAARDRLLKELHITSPALAAEWSDAQRHSQGIVRMLRKSGCYPMAGTGDVNTYAVFAELAHTVHRASGRAGIVMPTAIATSDTLKEFFGYLVDNSLISALYDFQECRDFFLGLESRDSFCLLSIRGSGCRTDGSAPQFVFQALRVTELSDGIRRVTLLPQDFRLLNPNTRTCPVFRNSVDATLAKSIYQKVPVLQNDATDASPWSARFQAMLHMANDSHLFRNRPEKGMLCLYEAKMFHQFDHRYSTYDGAAEANLNAGILPRIEGSHKVDPTTVVAPRYWVAKQVVKDALGPRWRRRWLCAFRNNARNVDSRSMMLSLLPLAGVGHNAQLVFSDRADAPASACMFGAFNTLVYDYCMRQKLGGISLSLYIIRQVPVPPPEAFVPSLVAIIAARIIELTYTAWDIKAFADDVWKEADDALREAIVRQWEENRAATGGHERNPPEWAEIEEDGINLLPFKWDEDRRAVLRAELDAYYAQLYGLDRKQLRYILDPHGLSKKELEDILDPWEDPTCSGAHLLPEHPALDFPGETFRVLKDKEEKQFGEYRTRRFVLEAWHRLHAEGLMPEPYDQRTLQEEPENALPQSQAL